VAEQREGVGGSSNNNLYREWWLGGTGSASPRCLRYRLVVVAGDVVGQEKSGEGERGEWRRWARAGEERRRLAA
jgi:hypothetical protein